MAVKQVIVMRKDLKMRRGKEIAQGAHASMAWLTKRLSTHNDGYEYGKDTLMSGLFTDEEVEWMEGLFTKITLQVSSLEELLAIFTVAADQDLTVELIEDAGLTEFKHHTITCIAIGPHKAELIDPITSGLKPY